MAQIKLNATYGMTGTLPAVSGANLTNLTSGNLTGALPAISGASLTTLNASNVSSGTLNAARYSGGKVLQCISFTSASYVNTNSQSYVNFSSMLVTITPASSSNKILLFHSAPSMLYLDNNSNMANVAIFRDSTNITTLGHNTSYSAYQSTDYKEGSSFSHLDSPNTTSAIEYRVKCKTDNSGLTFVYGTHYSNGSQPRQSSLIAMEIAA